MPEKVPAATARERTTKLAGGMMHPLNVHLRQEFERLTVVLDVVRKSLSQLYLAVKGVLLLKFDLAV
jgi:dynein heavy chain